MKSASRIVRSVVVAGATLVTGGCVTSPKAEAIRQQQMLEMGDAINDLRIATAELVSTVDSLRLIIARQDTTIARMANVTGVVVVK